MVVTTDISSQFDGGTKQARRPMAGTPVVAFRSIYHVNLRPAKNSTDQIRDNQHELKVEASSP